MRILLVAPELEGEKTIDAIPEMRAISAKHTVYSLVGKDVTVGKLFDTVDRYKFDIIHFASRMSDRGVEMSNSELLEPADCAQAARLAKATAVVFGGCDSNSIASYVINYGVEYAFFSNMQVTDLEVGKFALSFYNAFTNDNATDMLGAYIDASNKDGVMGWTMTPEIAAAAIRLAGLQKEHQVGPLAHWQVNVVLIVGLISMVLSVIALMR